MNISISRENMVFLLVGIPLWILNILFLVLSSYPWLMFDIALLIVLFFLFLYKKKEHFSIHLMKIGLVFFLVSASSFLSSLPQPSMWVEQSKNETDLSRLITPEDEYVLELKEQFFAWLATEPSINGSESTKYSTYYDVSYLKQWDYSYRHFRFDAVVWEELDSVQQVTVVDYYIRTFIVNWTSDMEVYGVSDYKATPRQILQQNVDNGWTAPAKDDCDGEAVVTVSLLKNLGFEAYIGNGRAHWFTVVNFTHEINEIYGLENPILLNSWQSVHFWSYFDEEGGYIAQDPARTFIELYYIRDERAFEDFYQFAENFMFLLYLGILLAAILLALLIGYPRRYKGELYDEEKFLRKERKDKVYGKIPWIQKKWNPLNWILYPVLYYCVIRTGNPFRTVYKKSWISIIFGFVLILIPVQLLLTNQGNLNMYSMIYLNIYIIIGVWYIERDVLNNLIEKITKPSCQSKNNNNNHNQKNEHQ